MKIILKHILYRVSKLKIMYKLLLIYIAIGMIPLSLISSYMTYTTKDMIMDLHKNQLSSENRRVRNILFNIVYLSANLSDSLRHDSTLMSILRGTYKSEDEIYKAYRSFDTVNFIQKNYTEISSVKIFVTDQALIDSGPFIKINDTIASSRWYSQLKNTNGELVWIYDDSLDKGSSLHLIRKFPVPKTNNYAYIAINISTNYLRFIINNTELNTVLSTEDSTSFYSNDYSEIGVPLENLYESSHTWEEKSFHSNYRGLDALTYISILNAPKSSAKFQLTTFDSLAYDHIARANRGNMRIILINLLVPLCMIIVYSIAFNRRILILRREMHKISVGNLDIIENFNSHDELGELFSDMQVTIGSIKHLNSRLYQEEISKQKLINYQQQMKFDLLANQINPHFLYNTLETIRMQLSIDKDYTAAQIVKDLGKYMRHNLEAGNAPVLLTSELDYIRIYMNIQHFRFGDRISYQILSEDSADISDYRILPLLIQPAVENAFVHGLEDKKGGGTVTIRIMTEDDFLMISVSDNGLGIPELKLTELLLQIQNRKTEGGKHIGLYNVSQRIKLFYGERYGINIESMIGQFTKVTYRLPLKPADYFFVRNEDSIHEIYHS